MNPKTKTKQRLNLNFFDENQIPSSSRVTPSLLTGDHRSASNSWISLLCPQLLLLNCFPSFSHLSTDGGDRFYMLYFGSRGGMMERQTR
jgi:hypothetical protein